MGIDDINSNRNPEPVVSLPMAAENSVITFLRHRLSALPRWRACLHLLLMCLPVFVVLSGVVTLLLHTVTDTDAPFLHGIWVGTLVLLVVGWPVSWLLMELLAHLNRQRVMLQDLVSHDGLTRLLNRRHFFERATLEVSKAVRHCSKLSLLMVDLDDLTRINQQLGQKAGDAALKAVADQARQMHRKHDLLARYGSEEFVLLLPGTGLDGALIVAERLRQAIAKHANVSPSGETLGVTVSIGLAELRGSVGSLPQLLNCADEAMAQAKRAGKNRCVVFNDPTR